MFNRYSQKYSQGIGLLELMLSISIIALVIIMATRYFTVVREQQRITQAVQMAVTIARAAHTWGAGQVNFTGLTREKGLNTLIEAKLLTEAYKRHPWSVVEGNTVYVYNYGGPHDFAVEFGYVDTAGKCSSCKMAAAQINGQSVPGVVLLCGTCP